MNKFILTGHTSGLGAALARVLLADGASVLALGRRRLDEPALPQAGRLEQAQLDLADAGAVADWLAGPALNDFLTGATRAVLINNAGQVHPIGPPGVQGPADIASAIALNVSAPLMLTDAFVAATGQCPDRRIVHVSSGAGRNPYSGWSVYCATKAALDHHARAVHADSPVNLRIESLAPGVIDTGMQARVRSATAERFPAVERFKAMQRDGKLVSPDLCAAQIVSHVQADAFGQAVVTDIRELSR